MQLADTVLKLPEVDDESIQASLTLKAWPLRDRDTRQAWDGADRFALQWLSEFCVDSFRFSDLAETKELLVLNDQFGALSLGAQSMGFQVTLITDSAVSREALAFNAEANAIVGPDTYWPEEIKSTSSCGAIIRVPKQLALLEYQLYSVIKLLPVGAPILVVGMDKHLPTNIKAVLERFFAPIDTLRGRFKAHGFVGLKQRNYVDNMAPFFSSRYYCEPIGAQLIAHAGVFSQQKTDPGGAFLCQYVPEGISGQIVDLGCGAGMIGLCALQKNPKANVVFVDESYQAIRSARENVAHLHPLRTGCGQFFVNNGLEGLSINPDLILLNPPFHQHNAVETYVGESLIKDAARALVPGGRLLLVQNRHLDYRNVLNPNFSQVEQIGQDSRFRVLRALR